MARTISAGGVSLSRKPAAPARRARSTSSSASKVVRTTTAGGVGLGAQQAGGGDAVELGHADVHEDDVGAVQVDGASTPRPSSASPTTSMRSRAGQHHPQPRAHERVVVDEQDADGLAHAGHGRVARRTKSPAASGPWLELAARQLDALGQPDEAGARAREGERRGRGDADRAAADDLDDERGARLGRDRHLDRGARRVLARVGQALLDDAIGRAPERRRAARRRRARRACSARASRPPGLVDERGDLGQRGLRRLGRGEIR